MEANIQEIDSALKRAAAAFKSQRQKAQDAVHDIMRRRRELEAEAEELRGSPVTRDDFLAAMVANVDQLAAVARARFNETLLDHARVRNRAVPLRSGVNAGQLAFRHVQGVLQGASNFGSAGLALLSAGNPNNSNNEVSFDSASFCLIFGDAIKAALKSNLEAVEWPHSRVLSVAQAAVRLEEIDREIERLASSEDGYMELLSDAIGG